MRLASAPLAPRACDRSCAAALARVAQVQEIFSELATIVSEQGAQIEHISSSIENTAAQTSRANEELRVASQHQAATRRRKCCLYGLGLLGGMVLLMVISINLKM